MSTGKPIADPVSPGEPILFVTGKLAESSLRQMLDRLAPRVGFVPEVFVAKITVAALMTARWLIGKLVVPPHIKRVVLPGFTAEGIDALRETLPGIKIEVGPKDLRNLPEFFAQPQSSNERYGEHSLTILAEINHANRLSLDEIITQAQSYVARGADLIDLGCTPGETWNDINLACRALVDRGMHVSVDSFEPTEVERATKAGAELVLSVNTGNRELAANWGVAVVVIPENWHQEHWFAEYCETIEFLQQAHVPIVLDPIVEPIGYGFFNSLLRYHQTRGTFPDLTMLMGTGNITELTAVDSAGVNAVLAAICAELNVGMVLTTEVANWCRSSVSELAIARQLMHFAITQQQLPKRIDERLITLRDPKRQTYDANFFAELRALITDPNFRLFADGTNLHALNAQGHWHDSDAFALFKQLPAVDPSHAFYLGWELMKASLANQLGKNYTQDQALNFGHLTVEETSHRNPGQKD